MSPATEHATDVTQVPTVKRAHSGHLDQIEGRRRGVPVEEHLRQQRASRKLLVPYITAGVTPDWLSYLSAYVEAGADAIEIGLPFSDPILDGPVIQQASHQALQRGTTIRGVLDQLAGFDAPVPLIAMTYANLVFNGSVSVLEPALPAAAVPEVAVPRTAAPAAMLRSAALRGPAGLPGAATFCSALAAAGIRGLIVPDLPLDELGGLANDAASAGVDLTLLAAPSTAPERNAWIAGQTRGFLYGLAVMGTTGVQDGLGDSGIQLAGRLKQLTDRPVLLGFGISTPEQAVQGARAADGVVIGSALMQLILDGEPPTAVGARVAAVRRALDAIGP